MTSGYKEFFDSLESPPDRSAQYYAELENLPTIRDCGRAITQYAMSLVTRGRLQKGKGQRFVLAPLNFVAFTPHHARVSHITVELWGNLSKFNVVDGVAIKDARNGSYSKCHLSKPSELAAVISYIRQAHANCIEPPMKSRKTHKPS